MKKIKVAIICGGKSGEHEVSLVSARSIFFAIPRSKYQVELIGIDKKGKFRFGKEKDFWINPDNLKKIKLNPKLPEVILISEKDKVLVVDRKSHKTLAQAEVFFPITHGTFGEDGCLQGFLEIMNAPYVGPGVLGSAVSMDKDFTKRLLLGSGSNVADFRVLDRSYNKKDLESAARKLGWPLFVKPANLGSSVGISKATDKKELNKAVKEAFLYDDKIVIEEAIEGREIECSVLGNEKPIASVPGEIKLREGFYSYEAKYIDDEVAEIITRAKLPRKQVEKVKKEAIKAYKTLGCEGMARVDFFISPRGKIYVNEINTLPGFTSISMYPKMFEEVGIKYPKLLDKLIVLAIERKKRQNNLKRNFN